jgi:hypothetical protein
VKDKHGNAIKVGDAVRIPRDRRMEIGGEGFIKRINNEGTEALVADCPCDLPVTACEGCTWMAWSKPAEIDLVESAGPAMAAACRQKR